MRQAEGQPGAVAHAPRAAATSSEPFDAKRAELATARVSVDRVLDLLHASHHPERIAEYREQMLQGARFPPIAVVRLAGRYLVADGHKRLHAYLGLPDRPRELLVECWIWRRWLADQLAQLRRKWGQIGYALLGGPRGWRLLPALVGDTLRHWWRVVYSLGTLYGARRRLDR